MPEPSGTLLEPGLVQVQHWLVMQDLCKDICMILTSASRYSFGVTLYVMLLGEDCADLEHGDREYLSCPQAYLSSIA